MPQSIIALSLQLICYQFCNHWVKLLKTRDGSSIQTIIGFLKNNNFFISKIGRLMANFTFFGEVSVWLGLNFECY